MKIGIESTSWANPRGYGRYTRGVISALVAEPKGHEFSLIVDRHTLDSRWPLPNNVDVSVVSTNQSTLQAASAHGRRSIQDIYKMSKSVSALDLDILFFPSLHTFFPVLTQAVTLIGIHDVLPEVYGDQVFPNRKRLLLWRIKSWLARLQADHIITVSHYSKKGIIEEFNWDPGRISIISEAPAESFKPINDKVTTKKLLIRLGIKPETRFLVYLGGVNPHKNVAKLVEALGGIRKMNPNENIELLIVGPLSDDNFNPGLGELKKYILSEKLDRTVHLIDFLPDDELALLLSSAEIFLLPSSMEGFGLGAVEAAACGTPVVATKHSPLPQLLEGGGIFVDPNDGEELFSAILKLLQEEDLRNKMGRAALEKAKELTWQKSANQFFSMLEKIA